MTPEERLQALRDSYERTPEQREVDYLEALYALPSNPEPNIRGLLFLVVVSWLALTAVTLVIRWLS